MRRTSPIVLAALAAALVLLSIWQTPLTRAAATRIMPLGDSITGAPGCWRALLWNRLQSSGYTNIDFVGTLGPQNCGVAHDGNNEGHAGYQAVNIANQNQLPGWLSATNPDIVMMHLGTNDIWGARSTSAIITAFGKLVDQMRANNPNMKIIVAKILPMTPSNCSACYQRVVDLNAAIPAWASGKSTAQSPIVVVDQWTGFNTATDTTDGVHPNSAGDQKMSDKWYPALTAFLSGSPIRTPTPVPGGTVRRMQSYNFQSRYLRHQSYRARIDENVSPFEDSQFRIVPGLANANAISFESVNFPGRYLRHRNSEIWLDASDGSSTFRADATWYRRGGLANSSWTSYESYNYPGQYMRHSNYLMLLGTVSGSTQQADATFREQ